MKQVNAAIYCRVSTEKQKEKEASLKTQQEESLAHCLDQGYIVDPRHIFIDAHTGTEYREREALSKLREAARKGEFDVVVFYAFDRLARDQVHQAVIIDDLEHHGVRLECVSEDFDDSATGQFMRSARAFAAQLEYEKIRFRTDNGRLQKVKSGKMIGGGIPTYGYRWNEERTAYLINEEEAKVVRYIYSLCKAGMTMRGISGRLRNEGVLNRDGKPIWHTSNMSRLLANHNYIGEAYGYKWMTVHEQGKNSKRVRRDGEQQIKLPEGTIPPIIDRETFEAAQEVVEKNKKNSARNNRDYKLGILRCGYIKCGYCGGNMTMRSRKSGSKHKNGSIRKENPCYICPKGTSGFHECLRPTISIEVLDPIVWEKVTERVKQLSRNTVWVDKQIEKLKEQNPREIELPSIINRLAKVEVTIKNLVAMSKKDLDADTLELVTGQLGEQSKIKKGLLQQQQQVETKQVQWEEVAKVLTDFRDWCIQTAGNVEDASYEQKRTALEVLGVSVQIWKVDHDPRYYIEMSPPTITKLLVSHCVPDIISSE